MKEQDLRIVHNKWLWERAGALETKLLKKYNTSLARISISQEFTETRLIFPKKMLCLFLKVYITLYVGVRGFSQMQS